MKCLAIIPARGGSKRIPNKNIKEFLGKPIISYSIECALNSELFETVMVSTDSDEIKNLSQKLGASIPFTRSNKNADDFASTADVLLEVIEEYEKQNIYFDFACCIYPTAPFVSPMLLSEGKELLLDKNFDTVFSVVSFSYPIQRALKLTAENKAMMFQPEHENSRSQDLDQAYHDSGQFYWFNVQALKRQKKLWTDNTGVIVLPESKVHDIDTQEDWKIAELKYKLLQNE